MSDHKKPDQVVYDEDNQKYNAGLKSYATNVGAPSITTSDTTAWKNSNIDKVNKQVKARYNELKSEFDELLKTFEYNQLVYGSEFNFEPVVGETYHLYKDQSNGTFLSIIAPDECNFNHLGSFRLNADKIWNRLDD